MNTIIIVLLLVILVLVAAIALGVWGTLCFLNEVDAPWAETNPLGDWPESQQ